MSTTKQKSSFFTELLESGIAQPISDYSGVVVELYDRMIHRDSRDIEFYERIFPIGARLLDLGSGTGRISVPLAKSGRKVFCVDSSEDMQKALLSKAEAQGLSERLLSMEGDIRSLELPEGVDGAILGNNNIYHLRTEDDLAALFSRLKRCLSPGGRLAIDWRLPLKSHAITRWGYYLPEVERIESRSWLILQYVKYDVKESVVYREYLFLRAAGEDRFEAYATRTEAEKMWELSSVVSLLERSGLVVEDVLENYLPGSGALAPGTWLQVVAAA